MLIANPLSALNQFIVTQAEPAIALFWLNAFAVSLLIYYDFSGYSDMAIGLGAMMGFHLPENFRYPFQAGTISEFWRRWHMSLTAWFRDYVYIPLGGIRKGRADSFSICLSSGCLPVSGTERPGTSFCGDCFSGCGSVWKSSCCPNPYCTPGLTGCFAAWEF
ncbi:hypothetical protein KWG61_08155 [Allobaculum sp. Allo2]|nr:hypothetical protein KWG61_08155 [Allobaculum sp. Allo2]